MGTNHLLVASSAACHHHCAWCTFYTAQCVTLSACVCVTLPLWIYVLKPIISSLLWTPLHTHAVCALICDWQTIFSTSEKILVCQKLSPSPIFASSLISSSNAYKLLPFFLNCILYVCACACVSVWTLAHCCSQTFIEMLFSQPIRWWEQQVSPELCLINDCNPP